MDSATSLNLAATLFGILIALSAWIGSRVVSKQDEILTKLDDVKDDLHKRITQIDLRLVRVETLLYEDK